MHNLIKQEVVSARAAVSLACRRVIILVGQIEVSRIQVLVEFVCSVVHNLLELWLHAIRFCLLQLELGDRLSGLDLACLDHWTGRRQSEIEFISAVYASLVSLSDQMPEVDVWVRAFDGS